MIASNSGARGGSKRALGRVRVLLPRRMSRLRIDRHRAFLRATAQHDEHHRHASSVFHGALPQRSQDTTAEAAANACTVTLKLDAESRLTQSPLYRRRCRGSLEAEAMTTTTTKTRTFTTTDKATFRAFVAPLRAAGVARGPVYARSGEGPYVLLQDQRGDALLTVLRTPAAYVAIDPSGGVVREAATMAGALGQSAA